VIEDDMIFMKDQKQLKKMMDSIPDDANVVQFDRFGGNKY